MKTIEKSKILQLLPKPMMLKWALYYAELGLPVIPLYGISNGECTCSKGEKCNSPGKHPLTRSGVNDASDNPKIIGKWFEKYPQANVGIVTGRKSGLLVLDIDPRNGGDLSLVEAKKIFGTIPKTVEASTGGGGKHLVFIHPKFEAKKDNHGKTFGRGVDVLGAGTYFVAPPSLHKSGKRYQWVEGKGVKSREVLNLPRSWQQQLQTRSVKLSDRIKQKPPSGSKVSMILEGNRNDHLTSIAGKLHATGVSNKIILSALQKENRISCNPPLDKDEVRSIARSIGSYPVAVNADSAEALMADVLQRQFNQGKNLIYAADGQFWLFHKTHWAVCQKQWLTGRILATITNSAVRSRQNTSSLVNQTLALLTAKQSINDDRLRFMADPCQRRSESAATCRSKSAARTQAIEPPISGVLLLFTFHS